MSSESWKLEKDLCRCCHSEGSFKNLAEPAQSTGLAEIYADMLNECFDIDMAPVPGLLSAATYTICEVCVIRLRDASDFKRQVLSCEERFKDLYSRNGIRAPVTAIHVEVKRELPDSDSEPDDYFKVELTPDDVDDEDHTKSFDVQISEEEDEEDEDKPFSVEATKKRKYKTRKNLKCKTTKKSEPKNVKEDPADDENVAEKKQDYFKVELTPVDIDDEHRTESFDVQISEEEKEEEQEEKPAPVQLTKKKKYTPKKNVKSKTTKKTKRKNAKEDPADDENDAEKKQGRDEALKFRLKEDCKKVGDTYQCARCDKTYDKRKGLNAHVKMKHYKIPTFRCSICNDRFITSGLLNIHKVEVHNVDLSAKCTVCNNIFKSKPLLAKHIKNFHMLGEDGKRYRCELCDYETIKRENMSKHKFTHKTVKDYHCTFCKKSFKRKSTLVLHEKIHTGDRNKVCTVCGQAFVQKASLNYHMTKYHPEVKF